MGRIGLSFKLFFRTLGDRAFADEAQRLVDRLDGKALPEPAGAAPAKPAAPAAPATGTTAVHADGVRRVTAPELQKMVEGGGVVIYDTRSKANYDQEHIKGALSMPHDEVERRAAEFPRDKTLAFYCT